MNKLFLEFENEEWREFFEGTILANNTEAFGKFCALPENSDRPTKELRTEFASKVAFAALWDIAVQTAGENAKRGRIDGIREAWKPVF